MVACPQVPDVLDLTSDCSWEMLYPLLKVLALRFVRTSGVSSWQGQERDLVEDITQETCRRVIEYAQKAVQGEVPPIRSLHRLVFTVCSNYSKDLRRRDRRLLRIQQQSEFTQITDQANEWEETEAVIESVYSEALFRLIAREVADFPFKQRRAILIDLTSRMHFGSQPSALQRAFLDEGIDLHEYRQTVPFEEKSRHTALVCYAYKRLSNTPLVKKYIATA